ncbi:MAG: response regulator [Gemmatimonadota bacterium]
MAKILIVEPDESTRDAIRALLELEDHLVTGVANAGSALLEIERNIPDLVLTELYMEGMDGLELIRACRRQWPGLRILSMTLGARPGATDTIQIAKLLGASAFLDKPLLDDRVVDAVDVALAS